jgi:ferredoxin--NADP+ reductase
MMENLTILKNLENIPMEEESVVQNDTGHRIQKIKDIIWHTSDIFELQIYREDVEFTPGDCLSIYGEDGQTSRPYSIASGNREPHIGFLIKHMEQGEITDYLTRMKTGDRIKVSLPYGWFRPGKKHGSKPYIFVATGTGIAPFLSYLKSYPEAPPQKCLYGVRQFQDAVGYNFLKNVCTTELAISREPQTDFYRGRVTGLIKSLDFSSDTHFYLCGLDAMIDEISEWLEDHGIEPFQIHTEVFFYASY